MSKIASEPQKRIIKRFGGRHLIFRTKTRGWSLVPHPYLLVSTFNGPIWFFYGVGQIWITHKRLKDIEGWTIRSPRIGSKQVLFVLQAIEPALLSFIRYCNVHGIEGTVVLEQQVIEFHWTFGFELEREKNKPSHTSSLETEFQKLIDAFLAATK